MKKGWETRTLGDLFEITSSKRVFESDWKREGVPFYRAREIVKLAKQGFVDNELFISEEMFANYSAKYGIPTPGDIMVTGVGTLGICYVVKECDRFYFKDGNIIWLKKRTDTDSRFVEYAFQSDYLREQIDDSVGATVGTYTIIKAKNTRIPIPPLAEQRRIVGVLDAALAGLARARTAAATNLQNARALFVSHLHAVFSQRGKGWVEKTLAEVSTTFGRGKSKHRPRNATHLYGGKYPFVQTGDIRNANHIVTEYTQTYSEAGLAQSKLWPKGTLCITIAANIAETAILDFDACFPDSVIGVVADPAQANVEFIEYLLQFFRTRIQAMGKGSAQANINMGTFEHERFPFPPVSEQRRIATQLDALAAATQRLAALYERKLAALAALRQTLLHQAFAGEL